MAAAACAFGVDDDRLLVLPQGIPTGRFRLAASFRVCTTWRFALAGRCDGLKDGSGLLSRCLLIRSRATGLESPTLVEVRRCRKLATVSSHE